MDCGSTASLQVLTKQVPTLKPVENVKFCHAVAPQTIGTAWSLNFSICQYGNFATTSYFIHLNSPVTYICMSTIVEEAEYVQVPYAPFLASSTA